MTWSCAKVPEQLMSSTPVDVRVLYYWHVQMMLAGANSGPRAITMPEWIRRAVQ